MVGIARQQSGAASLQRIARIIDISVFMHHMARQNKRHQRHQCIETRVNILISIIINSSAIGIK